MAKIELPEDVKKDLESLKVGDILVGMYSYNMTLFSFYKVIKKTDTSVKLVKLEKKSLGGNMMSMKQAPIENAYASKPFTRRVSKYGNMYEKGEYSTLINIKSVYNPEKNYCDCYMD